ncbi:Ig-like domain-containing protein [Erwinia sp.]|uniref:Ig-like domain-containing protein n=1 Tax=Erwinia citreus TaxID=558 RepID=UPI003C75FD1C
MSQRVDYRALRLESIFQNAVSDYAVAETTGLAIKNLFAPLFLTETENKLSPSTFTTPATSSTVIDKDAPAALRPYEPLAMDGVIAGCEANNRIHLRGRAEGEAGSKVTLTFNDQSWVSTVNQWGYWNASMPPEVLKGLSDGNYTLKLTITDKAGNSTDTHVDFGVYIDKTIKPTVTVETLSGDNAINVAESIYGLEVSGTSTHMANGSKITLKLGDNIVSTTVNSDGSWTTSFDAAQLHALQDGKYALSVTAVDPNGKSTTVTHDLTLITHMSSVPTLRFDKVTDDNVINLAESQHDLLFTGSLSTVTVGQQMVIKGADGIDHYATIDGQGNWQLLISAADLPGFIKNGEIHAWYHDGANNYTDMSQNLDVVTQMTPIYYEMSIGGDMILNYQEAQQDVSFYIEGITTMEINGKTYQPDSGGMITLPSADLLALADGPVTATAFQSDKYGNSDTETLPNFFTVATHDLPTLTLNTAFDDNVIDADDVNTWHLLQGSSTHLDQGSVVTLTLGDQSYSAAIKADGKWALTLLAGQLAPLDDGEYQLKVTAHDSAGNQASASESITVASHYTALNMDQLLAFYTPTTGEEQAVTTVSATTASTASQAAETTASSDIHTSLDANLVSVSPYTLADHLLQHNAVLV